MGTLAQDQTTKHLAAQDRARGEDLEPEIYNLRDNLR